MALKHHDGSVFIPDAGRHANDQISGGIGPVCQRPVSGPVLEPLPNILERFEPYLDWLAHSEILALRYEDFITDREQTIGRVFEHALQRGFQPKVARQQAIQILSASIDPSRSPTFRSGKTGAWQKSFTPAHKQLFKELTGDLLLRLGYEDTLDW